MYFEKALAIDPSNIDALYYKGVALYSFDKAKDAIAFYDEANKLADKALVVNPIIPIHVIHTSYFCISGEKNIYLAGLLDRLIM